MQQRAAATAGIHNNTIRKPRIGREQPPQPLDLALLQGCRELESKLLVTSQRARIRRHRG